jgi:antitoxin CptB
MNAQSPEAISKGYLQWRCRRGMKELDVMLVRFLEKAFESLSPQQRQDFDRFLDEPDTRIWQWLLGRSQPDDARYRPFIAAIRKLQ